MNKKTVRHTFNLIKIESYSHIIWATIAVWERYSELWDNFNLTITGNQPHKNHKIAVLEESKADVDC